MATNKISYAKMNLKVDTTVNHFDFKGNEIEVLQYLPAADKYDFIMLTLQKSEEDGIYNENKLDMYFHLHLIYMYTNISFTEKQREDEYKLYDAMQSNGLIDAVIEHMPAVEYEMLQTQVNVMVERLTAHHHSVSALVQKIVSDLPRNAEAAAQMVDGFDKEKYQNVLRLAAATGNRE